LSRYYVKYLNIKNYEKILNLVLTLEVNADIISLALEKTTKIQLSFEFAFKCTGP
jgi:hypothetical protein